jgi:hypothetical protein
MSNFSKQKNVNFVYFGCILFSFRPLFFKFKQIMDNSPTVIHIAMFIILFRLGKLSMGFFQKRNIVFEVLRKLGGPIPTKIEVELVKQGFNSFYSLVELGTDANIEEFLKEASSKFNLGDRLTIKSIASITKATTLEKLAAMASEIEKKNSAPPTTLSSNKKQAKSLTAEPISAPSFDLLKSLVSTKLIELLNEEFSATDIIVRETDSPLTFNIQCVKCPNCKVLFL